MVPRDQIDSPVAAPPVSCTAELHGKIGNLGLDKPVERAFRTYGPLAFVKLDPAGNDIVPDESTRLALTFTNLTVLDAGGAVLRQEATGRPEPPVCAAPAAGAVAVTSPVDGAHFVLEPHRPPETQRPPLIARPAAADLRWTIDGEPAERWVPTPGTHRVVVARGAATSAIDILYE